MAAPAYQVRLPVFEGPLDLLLHLIEQQELDITTISLAQVTDQYLAYLQVVGETQPDDLADFMVIAAQLLLIKSQALLPQPPCPVEEEEDIGEDLVRQLYEYKRFKQAAQVLQQREEQGWHMYPRTIPISRLAQAWKPRLNLEGTSLDDLIATLQALLSQESGTDVVFGVEPYTVTIEDKIAQVDEILRSLMCRRRNGFRDACGPQVVTFDQLLCDATSRIEVIVTLLAILEMIRNGRVSVRQEQLFGPITIAAVA